MESVPGKPDIAGVVPNVGNPQPAGSTPNSGSGPTFFDPGTVGNGGSGETTGNADNAGRRKRGRPRGSGRTGKPEEPNGETQDNIGTRRAPFSEDGVTAILLSIHQMLAGFTKIPEMEIEPSEVAQMAKALKGVADQYDIKPSEKSLAWINLATAASMVYGTRIFAYRARTKMEKAETVKPNPANVLKPIFNS